MKSVVVCLARSAWTCCLAAHARGIWLLALCWIAVTLGSGEVSAEDLVFKPVSNAPIVDNFIQVHNPSGEAGSYTIQFADNESDLVLDQVEGDLEAGASAFVYLDAVDVDDARLLTVTVSSTFPGFAQHLVWDPQQRVLFQLVVLFGGQCPWGYDGPRGAVRCIGTLPRGADHHRGGLRRIGAHVYSGLCGGYGC